MIDVGRDLEILEDQKIQITRRLKDYTQIATKESLFTRSFQGPVSSKNQDLLEGYGVLGANSSFNPHKGIAASWSFDAFTKFIGRLEVVSVIYKDGSPYLFNFNFYGEQKGLAIIFGSDRFSDLDWSSFDHLLTLNNIRKSWFGTLLNGDILYPLIDSRVGYFLGPTNLNLAGNIRNSNQPILLTDLKPAIRFQKMIKFIFQQYGLTITGDILDSVGDMSSVFVLLNRFSGSGRSPDTYDLNFCKWTTAQSDLLPSGNSETDITFINEVDDQSGLFDGLEYTSAQIGPHTLIARFYTQNSGTEMFGKYIIKIYLNGVVIHEYAQTLSADSSGTVFFISPVELNLVIGDKVKFTYRRQTYNIIGIGRPSRITNGFFSITPPPNLIGQNVSLNSQMTDDKIIEWIAQFIQSMNWIIKPDEFDSAKYELISSVDDRSNGKILDWGTYLDIENVLIEKPEVYKEIHMKYKSSKSAIQEAYRTAAGKGFGDLLIRPDVDFGNGEFVIENPCTLIPPSLFKIVDSQGIPTGETADLTIHKSLDLNGGAVNESCLLFHFNGDHITTFPYYIQSGVTGGAIVSEQTSFFPMISAFQNLTDPEQDSSLCFSLESRQDGNVPLKTAYARFWESDFLLQYDPASRVLKNIRLVLPPQEFYTYKLNDEIFLQNEYWKIIEIKHDKDGKQAQATLQSSRRFKPITKYTVSGGGKIVFEKVPSQLEKSAAGAFQKGSEYFGSFMIAQITPDLSRYSEIITQTNQTTINEINNINGRFRSYNEQS